jgi:hypothetical protein
MIFIEIDDTEFHPEMKNSEINYYYFFFSLKL